MNKKIVDSLLKVGRLKFLKRTGWVREGMPDPESVAEHTFRVCFLTFVLKRKLDCNYQKLLEMAIIHDIEESVTGDPVTQRGAKDVDEHDHASEADIVRDLAEPFDNKNEFFNLWQEHLRKGLPNESREANLLYQIGKIATAWQALEYELAGQNPKVMDEWWANARQHVKEPLLVELLEVLGEKRKK